MFVDILMDKKAIVCSQFADYTILTLLDRDMLNSTLFEKRVLHELTIPIGVCNLEYH